MQLINKLLCVSILILTSCSAQFQSKAAPNALLYLLDGQTVNSDQYTNDQAILMFWTSWCSACQKEIIKFNELAQNYPHWDMIAINLEEESAFAEYQKYLQTNSLDSITHAFSGNGGYDEAYHAFSSGHEKLPSFYVIIDRQIVDRSNRVKDLLKYLN